MDATDYIHCREHGHNTFFSIARRNLYLAYLLGLSCLCIACVGYALQTVFFGAFAFVLHKGAPTFVPFSLHYVIFPLCIFTKCACVNAWFSCFLLLEGNDPI
jgi:hypothetical protein